MDIDNIPEYTRAEFESFIEAKNRFDGEALLGVVIIFVVSIVVYTLLLWVTFKLFEEPHSRIFAALGLSTAMVIAALSYWGYVLLPRVEWLIDQLRGVGQRVYDSEQKIESIDI